MSYDICEVHILNDLKLYVYVGTSGVVLFLLLV